MTSIENYLQELEHALHVRGPARRRLVAECRDHLLEASETHGQDDAVARFGSAVDLARSFETDVAVLRGRHAAIASIIAVVAVAGSTLTLVNSAAPNAGPVTVWAVIFFASAQTTAVSIFLAGLQLVAARDAPSTAADVALLCRRNGAAIVFALVTLLAAGGAVSGSAAAWRLLIGPAAALLAGSYILRTRGLVRKLDGATGLTVREPSADLFDLVQRKRSVAHPHVGVAPMTLLALTVAVSAAAAFLWDHLDQGTVATSCAAAAIEVALVVIGFLVMGPALGLRATRRTMSAG